MPYLDTSHLSSIDQLLLLATYTSTRDESHPFYTVTFYLDIWYSGEGSVVIPSKFNSTTENGVPGDFVISIARNEVQGRVLAYRPSDLDLVELRKGEMIKVIHETISDHDRNGSVNIKISIPADFAARYETSSGELAGIAQPFERSV